MIPIQVIVRQELKKCEIWVDLSEKSTYKSSPEYQEALLKYKTARYDICVFIGGDQPLLPTVSQLLELQASLNNKAG